MERKKKDIYDRTFENISFFSRKEIFNSESKYQFTKNNFKNLNFLNSLIIAFLTFLIYQVNIFLIQEKSDFVYLKNKILNICIIFDVVFLLNFIFLLTTKNRNLRYLFIFSVFFIQESFIFFLFASINIKIEDNNNSNKNDINNTNIDFDRIEILKNFYLFYIFHLFSFISFDLKITNRILTNKINAFVIFIFYKLIIFLVFIIVNNFSKNYRIFLQEISYFIILIVASSCRYKSNNDLYLKLKKKFLEKNHSSQYFKSIVNMLNKSYLSFNLSSNKISSNLSFKKLLENLGITNVELVEIFNESLNKKYHNELLAKKIVFRKDKNYKSNQKNLLYNLKNKSINYKNNNINSNHENNIINKNNTIDNTNNGLSKINKFKDTYNNLIKKEDNNLLCIDNTYNLIQENSKLDEQPLFINISQNLNKKDENSNGSNFYDLESKKEDDRKPIDENCYEDSFIEKGFLTKLDFLLKEIFDYFIEDLTYNENNSSLKCFKSENAKSISDHIREIFYCQNNMLVNKNFTYKGLYSYYFNNKTKRISNKKNLKMELYYRKISNYKNEKIIEFYFNDVTTLFEKVEREREQNKIRSSILAKISHEFKTPLITIIYILKNYIDTRN